ncbi:hypothetical protein TrLO_g8215 [Triparma laevis f. longispina]|uniref:Uncharacterized protein n=1 Tax=Triparma laevis f. longispina TaxID=1714387 RepID=A0A9W7DMG1_9STRA|nr:hypothetical protein TrLO_g8215 [Triparma laevis f. longispina]
MLSLQCFLLLAISIFVSTIDAFTPLPSLSHFTRLYSEEAMSKEAREAINHIELQQALGIESTTPPPKATLEASTLETKPPFESSPLPGESTPPFEASPLPPTDLTSDDTSSLPSSGISTLPTASLPPVPNKRVLPVVLMFGPLLLKFTAVMIVKIFMDVIITPLMVCMRYTKRFFMKPFGRGGKNT